MSEKVYIPVLKGVYRHNILGVFDELEPAILAASGTLEIYNETYHDVWVFRCEKNIRLNDGELIRVVEHNDKGLVCREPDKYEKKSDKDTLRSSLKQ